MAVALKQPPVRPPALLEATVKSTSTWQNDLNTLFHRAKDRFPDVVWDLVDEDAMDEGDGQDSEVWGHKGMHLLSLIQVYRLLKSSCSHCVCSGTPKLSSTLLLISSSTNIFTAALRHVSYAVSSRTDNLRSLFKCRLWIRAICAFRVTVAKSIFLPSTLSHRICDTHYP